MRVLGQLLLSHNYFHIEQMVKKGGGVEGEGLRIQGDSQKLIKIGENCNLLAVNHLAL